MSRREWFLGKAAWAPEGRLIAYTPRDTYRGGPGIRVTELAPNERVVDVETIEFLMKDIATSFGTDGESYRKLKALRDGK